MKKYIQKNECKLCKIDLTCYIGIKAYNSKIKLSLKKRKCYGGGKT